MEFSGRLASFPMAELLTWAQNDRRNGSLVVRRSSREKRIFFRDGQIVACLTDDPAEFFGQFLLLNGHISQQRLLFCLSICKEQDKRLGQVLQEQGVLDLETIQQSLRCHIEDTICDLFLWQHGVFFFQTEQLSAEELLPEPIHTLGVVLEGTRWIDEHQRIRQVFGHDSVVLHRGPGWPGEDLSPLHKRIAKIVDGRQPLRRIYDQTRGSYFRFLTAAHELAQADVVTVEDAGHNPITTRELPLYDLLLEQAAEEQVLVSRNHFAMPAETLESFVPVWVQEPPAEEWERMPERVKAFYSKLDGQHRLVDILSDDKALRGNETELLLLQMGKGALALLPLSLPDLEARADERDMPQKKRWWQRLIPVGK